MAIVWKKLGCVFAPNQKYDWMNSHAAQPLAVNIQGDLFRIFFSSRNKNNAASVGFVDIDINRPTEVLRISEEPLLSPGLPGMFDENGISIGCILKFNNQYRLYYLGWNLLVTVPWHNSIGLAQSKDLNTPFERYSLAPILDRNNHDPISFSYPWILVENGKWRMWYGSNLKWGPDQRSMDHVIKYAESKDGIHWLPTGKIAIGIESPDEYAFSKPCVVKRNGLYLMWYSYRGTEYRIGYAESKDGESWERKDHLAGIEASASGWDDQAICYPNVIEHNGKFFMFYNGNRYGLTGFGVAVEQ